MDFKENITPRKGSDQEAKPLNMVFRAFPVKERDGYMLHAYLDQSAFSGFDKHPEKYEQVETVPYLTPKQSGPYQTDGAAFITGKLFDALEAKSNMSVDPTTGILNGTMTTTMTQRNGQWQPDIDNISGKGFWKSARVHAPEELAALVDRSITVARDAAKYKAAQKGAPEAQAEAQAEAGTQMQIPGLEDDKAPAAEAPAKAAPIADAVVVEAPEIPETDLEL